MYVFGYGSLSAAGAVRSATDTTRLQGWRRGWGVAMDNSRDLPAYKHYLDPEGRRPRVCVAFLDITPDSDASLNGVILAVSVRALERLDRRERNYRRVEVTDQLTPRPPDRAWAYVGRAQSRERRDRAALEGRLVVARDYHHDVRAAFARLGAAQLREFDASTAPLPGPLVDLRIVTHPAA